MGKSVSTVKRDEVVFEPLPPANEQELRRQVEFARYLASLHSEMYAWLTVPRKFYRFHGSYGENP
jgi:hypothetical protein